MWKDIEEFKGAYQVSDAGQVRKINEDGTYSPVNLVDCKNQFIYVNIRSNHQVFTRGVGNLVARTFIGEPPKGTVSIKHIDGKYKNNCLSNVKWNIPRAHTLPENKEARELYFEHCYQYMRAWAKQRGLLRFRINGYDIDDIFQEAAAKIWRYIDGYDPQRAGFFRFVEINCNAVFNKLYKREINKARCVSYIDGLKTENYEYAMA